MKSDVRGGAGDFSSAIPHKGERTRNIMEPDAKFYVAGHQGLVGGAFWRRLQAAGFKNLVGRSLPELDLRAQAAVTDFFG